MYAAPTRPHATRTASPARQMTLTVAVIGGLSLAMVLSAAALRCLA
jgi:hypothetical protein